MSPKNTPFHTLDELKAGLRFLTTLLKEEATQLDRQDLIALMNNQGVSQNQVYKNVNTMKDLGLIQETETQRGNIKSVHTHLTPKGRQVAELANKLKKTLT